ncbi:MAG: hypothetical protein KDA60_14690 [Planctomycetales bacterium]|nr:hypothetical protein [Planctomycetales bacterium]
MTMVQPRQDAPTIRLGSCLSARRCQPIVGILLGIMLVGLACPPASHAQRRVTHMRERADMPPGAIGRRQILRGGPLSGYMQPIEFRLPPGTLVSSAHGDVFAEPHAAPARLALQVGQAYRFELSNIPQLGNARLYPTVELTDRTYPPEHLRWEYPIPIEITAEEIRMAAAGKLVTRVVYIEDPQRAIPVADQQDGPQRYVELLPGEDPLEVANEFGRPVALVRIGARTPDTDNPGENFNLGSPPVQWQSTSASPNWQPPLALNDASLFPIEPPQTLRRAAVGQSSSPLTVSAPIIDERVARRLTEGNGEKPKSGKAVEIVIE